MLLNIVIICILCVIAYQDFMYREIYWFLFPLLICFLMIQGYLKYTDFIIYLKICVINMTILVIQLCLLLCYLLFKGQKFKSIINESIGIGDIAMFISCTFAFSTMNYVSFYLSSLIISLLIWSIARSYKITRSELIPLTGFISSYAIVIIAIDIFSNHIDRLTDSLLPHLVYG